MATFDITVPAGSGVGVGGSAASAFTEPGDFEGATIDSVLRVGTPTVTSDGTTDDTIGIRWRIQTDGGVAIWGDYGSDAVSAASASLGDGVSSDVITNGSGPTPSPATAVAADWDEIAYNANYSANMKDDAETVSWSSFTIRVTYTPSGTEFNQSVDGALSFVGANARETQLSPDGALSFVGAMARLTGISPDGSLSFIGTNVRETQKIVVGALSFAGALAGIKLSLLSIGGALSFTGDLTRETLKLLVGTLTTSGALTRETQKDVLGALTFGGALSREAQKDLAGALSFAGDLTATVIFTKGVDGTLTFVGTIVKDMLKVADGTLSFSGANARQIEKQLTGAVTFDGAMSRLVSKQLSGDASFVGGLVTAIIFSKLVIGTLSFIGGLATLFIPPVGVTIRLMWRSLWSRVWKDPGKKDEDS